MSKKAKQNVKMYCVKCKDHTSTHNPQVIQTSNGRYRLTGQCTNCGSTKSRFVSQQHASGLLGNLLKLPGGKIPILGDIPLIGNILF